MDAIVEHMAAAGLPQYTAALEANGYDAFDAEAIDWAARE